MSATIQIIPYRDDLLPYFRDFNIAWLEKYFYVEPIDIEIFAHPHQYILDGGGSIFFAKYGEQIAGTCALIRTKSGELELAKMAVDESFQGKGIGQALLKAAIEKAKQMGEEKLMLYSNTQLQPAIHLYKKHGFTEVPLGNIGYKRSNIKMEKML